MLELNLLLVNIIKPPLHLATIVNLNLVELLHSLLLWVQSLGYFSAIGFILIYVIATIALVPGSILTLGAGIVFGVVHGSIYVLIGAIIGETSAFLLGRYLARDWITTKIANHKTFLALDQALKQEGLKIIFLTRLSPIFPFSFLNYAFGITGISLKDYFLGSIGIIPMTITYVYLGSFAEDLATIGEATQTAHPLIQWTIKIVGFLATIAATFYITSVARQALNKRISKK